eukprot:scaffold878_cov271-Pinguiococcus_pyrenoidosus.AAC.31
MAKVSPRNRSGGAIFSIPMHLRRAAPGGEGIRQAQGAKRASEEESSDDPFLYVRLLLPLLFLLLLQAQLQLLFALVALVKELPHPTRPRQLHGGRVDLVRELLRPFLRLPLDLQRALCISKALSFSTALYCSPLPTSSPRSAPAWS